MPPPREETLRVYVDADVIIAALFSSSSHSAGQVILQLSEVTIIDAITSERAVEEVRRNVARLDRRDASEVLDEALRATLEVVPDPSDAKVRACREKAHDKDALHLACALESGCSHLLTYNLSDYPPRYGARDAPGDLKVVAPGSLVRRIRARLVGLA